jgi:hypothetical protein
VLQVSQLSQQRLHFVLRRLGEFFLQQLDPVSQAGRSSCATQNVVEQNRAGGRRDVLLQKAYRGSPADAERA